MYGREGCREDYTDYHPYRFMTTNILVDMLEKNIIQSYRNSRWKDLVESIEKYGDIKRMDLLK